MSLSNYIENSSTNISSPTETMITNPFFQTNETGELSLNLTHNSSSYQNSS